MGNKCEFPIVLTVMHSEKLKHFFQVQFSHTWHLVT